MRCPKRIEKNVNSAREDKGEVNTITSFGMPCSRPRIRRKRQEQDEVKKCEAHAIKSTNECYSKNQTYMYVTGAFGITRVEANTGAIFATKLKSSE